MRFCVLLVCCLFGFWDFAHGIEYTVGVENGDMYPFFTTNKKGEYLGFAKDVLDMFARSRKITFIYEVRPLKRLSREYLDERKFDFRFPDNESWNLENKHVSKLSYSKPVCGFIDGVIVAKKVKKTHKNMMAVLEKQGLGVLRGYSLVGYETQAIPVQESPNIETLLGRLKYGRVGGIYVNIIVGFKKLQDQGIKNDFMFDTNLPFYHDSFQLSSFYHKDILADFDAFLQERQDDILALKQRYGIGD